MRHETVLKRIREILQTTDGREAKLNLKLLAQELEAYILQEERKKALYDFTVRLLLDWYKKLWQNEPPESLTRKRWEDATGKVLKELLIIYQQNGLGIEDLMNDYEEFMRSDRWIVMDRSMSRFIYILPQLKHEKRDKFENHIAFRFKEGELQPVQKPHIPDFDSLLHIEYQKKVLRKNTLQFVKGLPANDALLWGERGTGKSSLVKSLLGLFASEGLRIVQVYRMDIWHLSELYSLLRERKEKFILFFDDLSFEPGEESFRILKSMMEGDIEERPENILIYATSNRRHLMPERMEEEKFPEESSSERISLVERFGIRLGFFAFGKEQYLSIVKHLATLKGLNVEESRLERLALEWALQRGFSGRSANQFIKDLEGALAVSEIPDTQL